MNYEDISKWIIPKHILDETITSVKQKGNKGYELFVFWAGKKIGQSSFEVTQLIIPKQTAYKSPQGAWVDIPGEELDRINMYLYKHKLSMPLQVHSHPGKAYHSQRDNEKSVLIFPGSISIVIPSFGEKQFHSFTDWAIYQKSKTCGWQEMIPQRISTHFEIKG
jgi:hypothetical protein